MATQTVINRQDPEIEAYRLGLLGDTQALVRDTVFGGNVQKLREQGLTDEQIAEQLGREVEDVSGIRQDQVFGPPDYAVEGISEGEQKAVDLAMEGIGGYQPFLDQAETTLGDASALMTGAADSLGTAGDTASGIASTGQAGMTEAAQYGITGAEEAAAKARESTALAQDQLLGAGAFGRQTAESGIGQLAGTTGGFDPSGIGAFMNQYEDAAVQQALADIGEAGERQRSRIGADAAASGAFGSRRQLREGMLDEEILDAQKRAAVEMRQAGFENAATRAQKAFEDQMSRGQSAAIGTGQLGQAGAGTSIDAAGRAGQLGLSAEGLAQTGALQGANLGMSAADRGAGLGLDAVKTGMAADQGIGALGSQLANVGMNYGQLGGLNTQLSAADIDRLLTTGGLERGINQQGLDATRLTNLQNYSQPFQLYGFQSDIYSGVPTGSSTMQVSSMPQTNPFQTAVGLGIGAYGAATGAQQAGLF